MLSDNLETKKPPPNWFIVQDVINRQIGSNPLFQRRFYSSLHAVNRLELKYKFCDLEDFTDVEALNFNQKGNLLARASEELVSIWDWAARKKRCCFSSGHIRLRQAKWLPLDVENFMVTSGYDGCIRLLNLEYNSSKQLMHYDSSSPDSQHGCPFSNYWSVAVHPEIPYVVFCAGLDSILSIDIREDTPKLLDIKSPRNSKLNSIHCNPSNSNEFCVGGDFPCVRVYDQRNISKPLYQLWTTKYNRKDRDAFATNTMYNHDGTEILTLCNCCEILLFDKSMWSCGGNSNHTLFERHQFSSVPGEMDERHVSTHLCLGHPHIPILATASESDVLIWMPSSNKDPTESTFKTYLHEDFYDLNYLSDDDYNDSDYSDDSYSESEDSHVRGASESPVNRGWEAICLTDDTSCGRWSRCDCLAGLYFVINHLTIFSYDPLENSNLIDLQYLTDKGSGFFHVTVSFLEIFKGTADITNRSESETSATLNACLYSAWPDEPSQPHFQVIIN
ncbi:PREDICTED: DDB1- and CUL4-associated factor 8-like protein 2 [Cyphomyrmex costatus]|uniref:DDB1- and CUL4-associated factor 8-like protein 2 n=1 Tax=Cyphomyrmex costatus TaxID=456900 RepID=UPI000852282F|nr:PREDICTED: DDB1- and CUL4-associated factor 8-like protein 2 [Cyphomyrmex costatus]